jgi:hypothetical protein
MNQEMPATPAPAPKRSNTWLIILIVIVVLCCLCLIVAGAAWQYGDQILKLIGVTP